MLEKIRKLKDLIENRYLTEKYFYGLIIRACLILALPVLYIGRYNHISGDCYWFAYAVHKSWQLTHNLFTVWEHSLATVAYYYENWQGTFTSLFFFTISPAAFGEQYAMVVPYMMMGMISISTILVFYVFLCTIFQFKRSSFMVIAVTAIMMQFQFMDSPASGLYWYNGAVHYVFMQGFAYMMIAFSCLFFCSVAQGKKKRTYLYLILAVFNAFMASGANYTTALFQMEMVLLLTAVMTICGVRIRQKRCWLYLSVTLVSAVGFLVNITAPGNAVRQGLYEKKSIWDTIVSSISYSAFQMTQWVSVYVVVTLLILLPVILKAVRGTRFTFPFPLLVPAACYCIYASMFAPGFYALGDVPFDRNQNICKMFFLISLIFCEIYLCGWLVKKGFLKRLIPVRGRNLWYWVICMGTGVVLCMVVFFSANRKTDLLSYAAWEAIASGEGGRWQQEYYIRLNEYVNNPDPVIYVDPYTTYVYPLWVYQWTEIAHSEDRKLDDSVARWYGKTAIYENERNDAPDRKEEEE